VRTPHVIVRAQWGDFLALVEGTMSVEDGLLTERLHLAGDATRLTKLAEVLTRR